MEHSLRVGLAQIAPIWLDKEATLEKVEETIREAASKKTELLVFPEGIVPGYPFWLAYTEGAAWDLPINKELHAHYALNAIQPEKGDLKRICKLALKNKMAIYLGIIERAVDRGGHSLYCTLAYIDKAGELKSVHRKLQPTYDERLTWSPGDGCGLRTHRLKSFTLGGLNCWENWMPLARAALYSQGENVHIAVWPGSAHNTRDITRFIARENRSYVLSVCGLMGRDGIPDNIPYADTLKEKFPAITANGGSCIAGPDGEWLLEPVIGKEGVLYAELDFRKVLAERQNFDPSGHYGRPDVTRLYVNRERQTIVSFKDGS